MVALSMCSDRPHYYLSALIKAKAKLFINHTCPSGREKDVGDGGELRAQYFSAQISKTGSFIIGTALFHICVSQSLDASAAHECT